MKRESIKMCLTFSFKVQSLRFKVSFSDFSRRFLKRFTPFFLSYWRCLRFLLFPAVRLDTPVCLSNDLYNIKYIPYNDKSIGF